ncbi:MAG: hypothetical protein AB8B85_18155 [Paracoccaceae bacterium]
MKRPAGLKIQPAGVAVITDMTASLAMAQTQPGNAAPFAGHWQVALPDGEGVVINLPDQTCDAPLVIEATGPDTIRYDAPSRGSAVYEIKSFGDNTPWWGGQVNFVSKWQDFDDGKFVLTSVGPTGSAEWDRAKQYTRCE